MEGICNEYCFGEGEPCSLAHGRRQVHRYFFHLSTQILRYEPEYLCNVPSLCACDDCNYGSLPSVSILVGYYCVKFAVAETGFVDT